MTVDKKLPSYLNQITKGKLIGRLSGYSHLYVYDDGSFFYLMSKNQIVYYIKYTTVSSNTYLGARENLSRIKNLTISVIEFLLDNGYDKIYEDEVFNKSGFSSLIKTIKYNKFETFMEPRNGKTVFVGEDELEHPRYMKLIKKMSTKVFHSKSDDAKRITEKIKTMFQLEDYYLEMLGELNANNKNRIS